MDLLEQVQSMDEYLSSIWREVEVFSLEKRRCWGDVTTKWYKKANMCVKGVKLCNEQLFKKVKSIVAH